jgi:serine/threonine protein kinase
MALHPLSLADYLSSDTANTRHCFHLKPALQLFLAILDGVQYLHDCGVVHRDLKPSNVFLTINTSRTPACIDLTRCKDCDSESRVKGFLSTCIGDFGLVTEIARGPSPSPSSAEHNATAPSKAVGTALYRPPTCATTASSEKLDVYALGIMLVELLIPFETKMERQTTLHDVRIGKFEHAILGLKHGEEHGIALGTLIRDMVHSDEGRRATCEQVRSVVEAMLADSA